MQIFEFHQSVAAFFHIGCGQTLALPASNWSVLFSASVFGTVSNTQTALALAIQIRRGTSTAITVAYDQLDRFVTPGTFYVPYVPPTGFLVLPPGSAIVGICAQLGFDAAVPLTVVAELGILG